jgi:hypothetical protein
VLKSEDKGNFKLNIKGMMHSLQENCVESIIEGKYGYSHARVFRILKKKGQLDEKQVGFIS